MALDIFVEINNAVLDLQRAQLQTYERPLRKLAQLLKHADLESYNAELIAGLDLDAFIAESGRTGGSMVGSQRLTWPEEPEKVLGLTWLLIQKFGASPDYVINFSLNFFYSGSKVIASIHELVGQLVIPFVRDYKAYIQSRGEIRSCWRHLCLARFL